VALSRGAYALHGCAVGAGGTLRCWGANNHGQAGVQDGTTSAAIRTPTVVPNIVVAH
jgi:hypothetical protein